MSREIDLDKDLDDWTDEELGYALQRDMFEDQETIDWVIEKLGGAEVNEDGLDQYSVPNLRELANEENIELGGASRKAEIIQAIRDARASAEG